MLVLLILAAQLVSAHSCAWVDPTTVIPAYVQMECTSNCRPMAVKNVSVLTAMPLKLMGPVH